MRKEGVLVVDHREVALARRQAGDVTPHNDDVAAVGVFEAGNEAQCRGFPRAGGAQKKDCFPVRDIQRDAPERPGAVLEGLR